MNSNGEQAGGPMDFLARFAGPLAWLVAGLLLLFGGVGGGVPGGGGMGGMGGMGGNPFGMGKSTARLIKDGDTKTTFGDVAGCDGAKEELVEVVDFLKNRDRYSALGAKIPKGALLVGPPGTGKTLLAKAIAGEAGVPFFSVSASEFVEMVGGVGAARVRDLFAQAKKSAPCIIFIDEIDAVGRQRSAGFGQGNDEREQTVNQLLTEMDGFEGNTGVVVVAATNRADILDKALVRPGRFDRQVQVDPPDVKGRIAILNVHAKDKTLGPDVDLDAVARQTPGMSGADLANLLNEGAIVAARSNKDEISSEDITTALDRIMIGLEKKDAVMSEAKRKLVAYHEAGHAVLGALMNDYDVVTGISIVPRGPAGGVTKFMPSEDRLESGLYSKELIKNWMCFALGGRIAEEIINGADNVTTGASNDFQQCTQVAQTMVMQLGMSEKVGQRAIGEQRGGGGGGGGAPPVSQSTKRLIDEEVKMIVDEQYARGKKLLSDNFELLDALAKKLIVEEKMTGQQLTQLINSLAGEGRLVMAGFSGERVYSAPAPSAFAGRCSPPRRASQVVRRAHVREVADRLGLEVPEAQETTDARVMRELRAMTAETFRDAVPDEFLRPLAATALAALAATSAPLSVHAEDAVPQTQLQQPVAQMQQQGAAQRPTARATYSRLLEFMDEGAVSRVDLYDMGRTAVAEVKVGDRVQNLAVELPGTTTGLMERMQKANIVIDVHTPEKPNIALQALGDAAFPLIVIAGLLFLRSRAGAGGDSNPMNMGQSKAKIQIQPETGVKFADVAGIDEAKEELTEIVDFMKAPERFVKVGAKIPKGVLP